MYSRILVPLDGSRLSETALLELPHVAAPGGQIRLLTVITYPVYDWIVTDPALGAMVAADMEHVERDAQAYLVQVAAALQAGGYQVACDVHSGPTAETILDAAERMHAELILMATHGRGGVGRFLLGGIAARIVQLARVPVLLVRPRERPAETPARSTRAVEGA